MTTKLAYTTREAAAITPFGYDTLLGYIRAGQLKAKRTTTVRGGKFVILHTDLMAFLENLDAA